MARAKKPPAAKPAKVKLQKAAPAPRGRLRLGLALLALLAVGVVAHALLTLPSSDEVAALGRKPPKTTALIEARRHEAAEDGRPFRRAQRWVPIGEIAPELIACVLASEDARFFLHEGVDVAQLKAALKQDLAKGRFARGASTLTQQLAKNLWLSERKNLLRKVQEAVLARRLEDELTKERILELYLNEVEWGDGVYGAEAAARAWFGRPARDLTLAQAATLAAMLPSPRRLSPEGPSAELLTRTRRVLDRVADEHLATPSAVELAKAELGHRPSS